MDISDAKERIRFQGPGGIWFELESVGEGRYQVVTELGITVADVQFENEEAFINFTEFYDDNSGEWKRQTRAATLALLGFSQED